jgi:membrane-associated protein
MSKWRILAVLLLLALVLAACGEASPAAAESAPKPWLERLIEWGGLWLIFFIVFAESGLFFGFFFPGDSLLLTAGLLASRGLLNIYFLVPGAFICAVAGDSFGYWFGSKTGPLLFKREESLFFKPRYLAKAQAFYEKHGGIAITLARFIPAVRTFVPIVAGAARMNYRRFIVFNVLGGFLWAVGMSVLGYVLGRTLGHVEGIDKYFLLLVLAFFFIPGLPTLIHLWKDNRERILALVKKVLTRKRAPEAEE